MRAGGWVGTRDHRTVNLACPAERAGQARDGSARDLWPRGFTRAHRHAGSVTAYVTKGEIRSQLGGGPVEIFKAGQSFFEPPGATHLISANASNTVSAELIAVFVADEGAPLATFLE
jgi:quercetin dioxygenase-like cupin family protein